MNADERDDSELEGIKFLRDQGIIDADEAKQRIHALSERRARDRLNDEAALPDPSPGVVVVEGPPAEIPLIQYDVATGRFSGGRVDHNRPPEEFPGYDAL